MTELGRPPVLLDIVEEHFEELDFLWEQREGVIFAPDWNLEELAELEERAEAHLDGLRLAEAHAVDIARPALAGEETFAATAATLVFMETGVPELAAEVLEAFKGVDVPETRDGIRIGLRHSKIEAIRDQLLELTGGEDLGLAAAAADVLAFHRITLPDIHRLLASEDPGVGLLALGALGRLGEMQEPDLASALESESADLRRAALEAAARSGLPDLATLCRRAASREENPDPEALAFLGVLGDPADLSVLQAALGQPGLAVAALRGLGALGRVEAIPRLIELMENPELASAAGAAFQRITGAEDIAAEKPPPPPADEVTEEEEFADDTPPPDPARAQAHWNEHQAAFDPNGRWQAGQEVNTDPLGAAFNALPLEARRDVYLGARARSGSTVPDLELEHRARSGDVPA